MSKPVFISASTSDNSIGESRIIITSPEVTDMKQAVDEHFQKSLNNAMANFATSGGQLSRQWPDRNLPKEFSNPPSAAKSKTSSNTPLSHSRDGSTDSSGRYTLSPPAPSPLVSHSRTHSSPAIIGNIHQKPAFVPNAQTNMLPIQHQRYRSFDTTTTGTDQLHSDAAVQDASAGSSRNCNPQLYGEKTSKSLGDLATTGIGAEFDFHREPMAAAAATDVRKSSCDSSMAWQEFSSGQNVQKTPSHFTRHSRNSPLIGVSSGPSCGVQRQILKRQQQQHQQLQQQHHLQQQYCLGQPHGHASGGAVVNPVIQEMSMERQRMYERNRQLQADGLLDPLPPAQSLATQGHFQQGFPDAQLMQYPASSPFTAARTMQNPQFSAPAPMSGVIHQRHASSDSGLGMHLTSGGYGFPYVENPSDMDLNFANISLDPSSLMDLDPTSMPPGPLDIAPDDLDQYLNH